jgi:UrcA family protein
MLRAIVIATLSLFAAIAAAPASAETRTVGSADLNLASPAGIAQLHRRVGAAITAVCGRAEGRDLAAIADLHRCRGAAMASTTVNIAALVGKDRQAASVEVLPQIASR